MTKKNLIWVLYIAFFIQLTTHGQTKVQVVTKSIQKSFDYKSPANIDINAEKAKIILRKSNDNKINLRLALISKNPSKEKAEHDLKYFFYQIEEKKEGLFISNFFNFKFGKNEASSMLSVRIELDVPDGINLKLRDLYGEVELSSVQGAFDTWVAFGTIKFSKISGSLKIYSDCSDIIGLNSNVSLNIEAQKAEITLDGTAKPATIKNQYGSVLLNDINADITVNAEMSAIEFRFEEIKNYSIEALTSCGDIEVPKEFKKQILHYKNFNITCDKTDSRFITAGKITANFKTSYNTIHLKQK